MKKLFFLFFFASFALQMNAQKSAPKSSTNPQLAPDDAAARSAVEKLTAKYGLNADQAKQMYTIQARKQRNTAEIAALQTNDPAMYRAKVESIQRGTAASIRRILHSKEQLDTYNKTQASIRSLRAQKRKEMMVQGAKKEEIEMAVLAVYEE